MNNSNQFDWVDFYKEFALALTRYNDDHSTLIQKITNVFKSINIKLPTLEKDSKIVDIDPFTVFGLFNKSIKNVNRIKILEGIAKEFNIKAAIPTKFDGIPVLLPMNATFYKFIGDRKNDDISNIWELFIAAMNYTKVKSEDNKKNFADNFDIVIKQKGVGPRITMGLYWIAPDEYLNLDSRNRWYIFESGKIASDFVGQLPSFKIKPSAAEYFKIMGLIRDHLKSNQYEFKDFKELSYEAWRYSEEVNQQDSQLPLKDTSKLGTPIEFDKPAVEALKHYPKYDSVKFREEVYMDKESYEKLVSLLKNKKNVILQGPPGVGKTYAAKRLAFSMMGEKNEDRVMMVQFHQSYSYEDFIMGIRPTVNSFELKKGAFYKFCEKASGNLDNQYFFIIDEINRGNLSKIFGELFMLIENDKRGIKIPTLYSDKDFSVPKNLYIIGMMNTADRSLAMLDYALRRRFAFYEIKPGFETKGFENYKNTIENPKFKQLISCVNNLNSAIRSDESLGEGFCIGHSFFCNLDKGVEDKALSSIVEYELIPLLNEYWFDEKEKVKNWSGDLRSAIK